MWQLSPTRRRSMDTEKLVAIIMNQQALIRMYLMGQRGN